MTTFAGSLAQTLIVGIGLLLVVRQQWVPGLKLIRACLFVTLTFTLVMDDGTRVNAGSCTVT